MNNSVTKVNIEQVRELVLKLKSVAATVDSKIRDCVNNGGAVASDNYVGGIVGSVENTTIRSCANRGSVQGNGYIGGIVGYVNETTGTYTELATTGVLIRGTGSYFGGIFGSINNQSKITLTQSYVGGFIQGRTGAASYANLCGHDFKQQVMVDGETDYYSLSTAWMVSSIYREFVRLIVSLCVSMDDVASDLNGFLSQLKHIE